MIQIVKFKDCCYQICVIFEKIEQDSKELSPRSLDKMLLKRQVNSQNVQSTQLSKFFKFSKSSKFFKLFCMIFKHVYTCLDSIWYELLWFIGFSNMSEHVETCLNLFRFNVIWIDTILKHVWTCSNMSILVQIQYDINCYNS